MVERQEQEQRKGQVPQLYTVCQRCLDPFYVVRSYKKWVKTYTHTLLNDKKELANVLPNTLDAQVGELHLHGVRVDVLCAHAKLASVRNLQIQVQDMYTRVSKCQNIPMF